MKFKKIVCAVMSAVVLSATFCQMGVNALYGNAHFNLGKKIVDKMDEKLSESEKSAFLSGMVYADIGRFKFDKETGIESDSEQFAEKMKELAETPEEKWFARGFEMHVLQDNKTRGFLEDIFDCGYYSYSDYMNKCGTLDCHFLKQSGVLYNEFLDKFNFEQVVSGWDIKVLEKLSDVPADMMKHFVELIFKKYSSYPKKNKLVMFDELIKNTYESLGFEVSLDEIHEQAGNVLGAFMIISAVIGKKVTIYNDLASRIETQSDSLADLCVSKLDI